MTEAAGKKTAERKWWIFSSFLLALMALAVSARFFSPFKVRPWTVAVFVGFALAGAAANRVMCRKRVPGAVTLWIVRVFFLIGIAYKVRGRRILRTVQRAVLPVIRNKKPGRLEERIVKELAGANIKFIYINDELNRAEEKEGKDRLYIKGDGHPTSRYNYIVAQKCVAAIEGKSGKDDD